MLTKGQMIATEQLCIEYIERKSSVFAKYQLDDDPDDTVPRAGRETAALRRTSMELTRALADLRASGAPTSDEDEDQGEDEEQPAEPEADPGPATPSPRPSKQQRRGGGRPTSGRCACGADFPIGPWGPIPVACRTCRAKAKAAALSARRAKARKTAPPPAGDEPGA